jgi:hypothetical protein
LALKLSFWNWSRICTKYIAYFAVAVAVISCGASTARVLFYRSEVENNYFVKKASQKIAQDRRPGDKILALSNHLVLFYLHEAPIDRFAAHPSNLSGRLTSLVQAGYTFNREIAKIFASVPRYIVTDEYYCIPDNDDGKYNKILKEEYRLWYHDHNLVIDRSIGEQGGKKSPVG